MGMPVRPYLLVVGNMGNRIKLYMVEEQEILREVFRMVVPKIDSSIDLVGISTPKLTFDGRTDELPKALADSSPDVVFFGLTSLDHDAAHVLNVLQERYSSIAPIVMCSHYKKPGLDYLRRLLRGDPQKGAYLFKHSLDSSATMCNMIRSVASGHLIIDSAIFQYLMEESEIQSAVFSSLAPTELEVLNWMARGYHDAAIAHLLSLDQQEIRAHIDGIFNKLSKFIPSARDARTTVVLAYLRATGAVTPDMVPLHQDLHDADPVQTMLSTG